MAASEAAPSPPALTFPPATFAKLSPRPFLLAHLSPSTPSTPPVRPNGRQPTAFRPPTVHTGSLTHADGSAVIRVGDTAVVCGVRAEVLLRRDVPDYRPSPDTEIQTLSLLVPNLELSTGCSPAHLPGNPPTPLAQTLTARLLALLHTTHLVPASDLRIWHHPPDDAQHDPEIVAFWTLHISCLFISLSGAAAAFDAAWAATVAALEDTRLPLAWWDSDRQMVLCDDRVEKARRLSVRGRPFASTMGVFGEQGQRWVLADPDGFEEGECGELVTVVVEGEGKVVRIEKWGGGVGAGKEGVREMVGLAGRRWGEWAQAFRGKTSNA